VGGKETPEEIVCKSRNICELLLKTRALPRMRTFLPIPWVLGGPFISSAALSTCWGSLVNTHAYCMVIDGSCQSIIVVFSNRNGLVSLNSYGN
jgi:hypothetical protein